MTQRVLPFAGESASNPRMPAQQRIVIAEDDAKTASLLRLYLEHAGYAVFHARTGKQAIVWIAT